MNERRRHFSAKTVKDLRASLREVLQVQQSPEPPEGLSIMTIDPSRVTRCLKTLHLKPGLVLRGYQFYQGGNGNGFIFAMPEDSPLPEPDNQACARVEKVPGVFLPCPQPDCSLEHFMDAFTGDGSPLSFLEASIVKRELEECGAFWHGCSWGSHRIVTSLAKKETSKASQWTWSSPAPKVWRPTVTITQDGASVLFFSYSEEGCCCYYRHLDEYTNDSYRPCSHEETIATGPMGYIC